ncbi:segregation/condensation protein A [Halobacteriales archaeon QS_5_70_17]|nr:MAG: segregation/condensation protein A [Halobacteriales archaeon QS_5_70_17]
MTDSDVDPDALVNIANHEDRERPGDETTDADTDANADADAGDERASDRGPEDGIGALGDEGESEADGDTAADPTGGGGGTARPDGDPEGGGEGDADEGVEPVELLVQLADRGEIEPWDIDIVAVTDKFLAALDDADLRTGGRALFYASVLLRMKSDALMDDDDPDEDEAWDEPWEEGAPPDHGGDPEEWAPDPVDALKREMDRRLERKRARGMPETLDELIRELREAERGSWWKESRSYDTSDSPTGFRRGTQTLDYRAGDDVRVDDEPTAADVTGTAHGEDMETTIRRVNRALREQYDAGRDEVLYDEIDDAGGSRVETYLAVLFLAHRGQIRLQQDELFGDLWVQDPNAVDATAEAVAD